MKQIGVFVFLISFITLLPNCKNVGNALEVSHAYPHWVGDIAYDPAIDSRQFQLCDSSMVIHRRNALRYRGGKSAIEAFCRDRFKYESHFKSFSGYIVVRFLLNCKMERGRFRSRSLGLDFSPKDCPVKLQNHIMDVVKQLDEWYHTSQNDTNSDCSKYLNFKIDHGKIEAILH